MIHHKALKYKDLWLEYQTVVMAKCLWGQCVKGQKNAMSLDENAIIREGFGTGKGFTFAGCAPGTLVLPVAQGDPCAPVPPKGGLGGKEMLGWSFEILSKSE